MIEKGDTVEVRFDDGMGIVGIVLYVPSQSGDSWAIRGISGDEFVINLCCSKLLWIRKQASESEPPAGE